MKNILLAALLGAGLLLSGAQAQAQSFSDNYPQSEHWFGNVFGSVFSPHTAASGVQKKARSKRSRSVSLAGVVAPLANKAREIEAACGARVISAVRHTYVRGSGRLSLHASGRAVDMVGNPSCIRAHLRDWPGGVSTDYHVVKHYHISYSPNGREWGARFAHYRGGKKKRVARSARRAYAAARP